MPGVGRLEQKNDRTFAFATITHGVSNDDRYKKQSDQLEEDDGEVLDAVQTIVRWNLSRETTYRPKGEVGGEILEKGKELEENYGNRRIPLLLRANPYKLSVLSFSFALLEGATEPTNGLTI
ncbi:hypothetical protein AKJ65_00270 [candidate division MSBL1 archaeon SCGC-AAA259E19]|uniref:Uncharacterized protein n=1 Tax=candidate division MSBL1 archaeon SCGC-AAA259E19 TaxID=1698264 RepID=A0A133UNP0_9EURY|nr:hypothetical protein AKJ65_00270 [candidate division MSBL1 archaeon SCGC-AAA259E19]